MINNDNKDREQNRDSQDTKPDPETLHKTDPQENMEGPVSSSMKKTGEAFDTDETKEEADRERDRKM
jgi:hypothetical protein